MPHETSPTPPPTAGTPGGQDLAPKHTQLKLVGYFAKRSASPEAWREWCTGSVPTSTVREICSVSNCLTGAPEGWVERWLHNDLAFFNTVADALSVVPPGESGFSLFAYRLLPRRFTKGEAVDLALPTLPVQPFPASFRSLGFDVVSKSMVDSVPYFACSPLSCNGMAAEVRVNAYCLLDSLETAIDVATDLSRDQPEPGDYFVLDVLRGDAEC